MLGPMVWLELDRLLPPVAGTVARFASVIFTGIGLALVPLVLVRRKEPSSTVAWILTLVFLPALGALLFLLFGRDRVRWPARRKRELDALVRAQVAASRDESPDADGVAELPLANPLERSLFRIGARLAHQKATGGNLFWSIVAPCRRELIQVLWRGSALRRGVDGLEFPP